MGIHPNVVVVGCGGTGGFVAEGLCRILARTEMSLVLVDYKTVRPHNLRRQHFYDEDLGKFKSKVMAERLTRHFGRTIGYCTLPYRSRMIDSEFGENMATLVDHGIIIGCVDGPEGRRAIADNFMPGNWWIDAGNSYSSGQVLIGNASQKDFLKGSFNNLENIVSWLPLPSMQIPSLLAPPSVPQAARQDCDEAIDNFDQSSVINLAMATLVLEFFEQLIGGTLMNSGAYIDLSAMTLIRVPAEPETIARMCGLEVDTLLKYPLLQENK